MDAERRGQEQWDMHTELAAQQIEVLSRLAVAWGALRSPIDIQRPEHIDRLRRGETRPESGGAPEGPNPYAAAMDVLASTRRTA